MVGRPPRSPAPGPRRSRPSPRPANGRCSPSH